MTEREIIATYSTPGLRKSELSKAAKKLHLARIGIKPDQAADILVELYPDERAS